MRSPMRVRRREERKGLAALEMALVAPILIAMVVGALEMARVLHVKQVLSDACRTAGRQAVSGKQSATQVAATARSVLSNNKLDGTAATVGLTINGSAVNDLSSAGSGDFVGVTVTIPANTVGYVTPIYLSKSTKLSQSLVFMK